ncbi:MAG TPA: MATE family efflux transporter, partial [Panacibacter sp.]|nr:MATE family efflux transporter [Panacibacter sp.]
TVTNILLDYALIYGHFGLPKTGFNGAAIASIIAEVTGVLVIFAVMKYKGISKKLLLFKNYMYDAGNTRLILVQSSPIMLQFVISVVSWEFFYILIEHHGARDLAVSNVMRNMFGLFGCVTWAFASATNAMVSNVIGQGLQHKVTELILKIMKLSLGFACIIFLLLNIAPELLLKVYGQGNDFVVAAVPVARVVSIALLIMSVATVWLNAVIGTGNTTMNLIIEVLAIVFYCIYVYTILEYLNLSITFGWMAEWIYWLTILIPSFFYMQSGRWKDKKI